MFDCCAREASQARRGQRRAVPRDARGQRGRLGEPEREPVGRGRAPLGPRRCGRGPPRPSPAAPASSPTAVASGPPSRRSIGRSKAKPRSPGEGTRARPPPAFGRRRSRSSSAITRRWPISSAAAAPAWSATSKLFWSSGSQVRRRSQPGRARGSVSGGRSWIPGSSSVGPWTAPRTIALDGSHERAAPRRPLRSPLASAGSTCAARVRLISSLDDQRHDARRAPRSRGSAGGPSTRSHLLPTSRPMQRQRQHPGDAAARVVSQ